MVVGAHRDGCRCVLVFPLARGRAPAIMGFVRAWSTVGNDILHMRHSKVPSVRHHRLCWSLRLSGLEVGEVAEAVAWAAVMSEQLLPNHEVFSLEFHEIPEDCLGPSDIGVLNPAVS